MAVDGAPRATIVVPCHDEVARLQPEALVALAATVGATVLAVDDGSTDGTGRMLAELATRSDAVTVLTLPTNVGKGESVRHGLRRALADGAELVGYYDADGATPAVEMARLVDVLRERPEVSVVLGARVGLLGHDIVRSRTRHYLGRVFATASSLVLGLGVYDTQCGAKALRAGPALDAALAVPFRSRWAFDVELLDRLGRGAPRGTGLPLEAFVEVPLRAWRDVAGSKLGPGAAFTAATDLARIAINRAGTRRGPR